LAQFIRKRLPSTQELVSVFGFLLFVIFTWSIRGFLFKLPSFLLYYSFGDIIGVLAYMMSFSLVESTIVYLTVIVTAIILPVKWLRDGFSWKGGLIILSMGIWFVFLQNSITFRLPTLEALAKNTLITFGGLASLWILCIKIQRIRESVENLMERFSIFAYLYVVLGVASLMIVLIRNVF